MGHSEVAESPCEERGYRKNGVLVSSACFNIVDRGKREVAGDRFCVVYYVAESACIAYAENENAHECERHDDTLNEVGRACCEESACAGVSDDNYRAYEHRGVVVPAKERIEELSAG